MSKQPEKRLNSIQLYQKVVQVWHGGHHVHLLNDVIEVQLRFHKPRKGKQDSVIAGEGVQSVVRNRQQHNPDRETICQSIFNRPTKKNAHPNIILSHNFLGKSISSLQKSILDSDLVTGFPLSLQSQVPFQKLWKHAATFSDLSAHPFCGLVTITSWNGNSFCCPEGSHPANSKRTSLSCHFRSRANYPPYPKENTDSATIQKYLPTPPAALSNELMKRNIPK